MKKLLLLLFAISSIALYAQDELSPSDWKMTQAKMFFEDEQTENALEIYLELHKDYSSNDFLNLRIAECYCDLHDYENAIFHLRIARDQNPQSIYKKDIDFWFGVANHKQNKFDEAYTYYEKVKSGTETIDSTYVQNLMLQCQSAIELSSDKIELEIENLGDSINSEYNEIFPVPSFGEEKLYFTSDRSVNDNQDAHPSTGLHDYSILESYISEGVFFSAEVPDQVFSNAKDYILTSVGAGNGEFVLYKNSPEYDDNGDVYYLKLTDELDISQPLNVGTTVNSLKYEGAASLDFINQELFLSTNSNNKKGEERDIFYGKKRKSNFSNIMVVDEFSGDYDEDFIYVHPGGDFAVFTSNDGNSVGGYDLFISIKKDGKWSDPVNMGFPFNSVEDEKHFSLSVDGKYAYLTSDRPGGKGRMDIYRVAFDKYFEDNFGYHPGLCVIQGQITDENYDEVITKVNVKSDVKDCYNQKIETDNEGYFAVAVKPGRIYQIEIKQSPYEKHTLTIDLKDSSRTWINFDIELKTKE